MDPAFLPLSDEHEAADPTTRRPSPVVALDGSATVPPHLNDNIYHEIVMLWERI